MSTPRTDSQERNAEGFVYSARQVVAWTFARELETEIAVYRAALEVAAQRFRTMKADTAAEQIETLLKETP